MIAKANRPLTHKQELFCQAMYNPGSECKGNGTESARKAGYKGDDNVLGMTASRMIRLDKIITRKEQIIADKGAEMDRTVQSLDDMYQEAYDTSLTLKQPSAMVSAVTGIARLYGMDKDNQTGKLETPDVLTPEQLSEAKAMATRAQLIKLSKEGA